MEASGQAVRRHRRGALPARRIRLGPRPAAPRRAAARRGPRDAPWLVGSRLRWGRSTAAWPWPSDGPRGCLVGPAVAAPAWGVNALLPAGGVLYVASLRGAARFDGAAPRRRSRDPARPFSLAATTETASRSATARACCCPASTPAVGLPRPARQPGPGPGLGRARSSWARPRASARSTAGRVRWRVAAGEGKLPHPWVTALAAVRRGPLRRHLRRRRRPPRWPAGGPGAASTPGRFEPFVETEGLKVNPGCLVEAGGRLYAGHRRPRPVPALAGTAARFEPLRAAAALPPRDRAARRAGAPSTSGTDEGLARLPARPHDDGRLERSAPDMPRAPALGVVPAGCSAACPGPGRPAGAHEHGPPRRRRCSRCARWPSTWASRGATRA